jgi:hypothetical protein
VAFDYGKLQGNEGFQQTFDEFSALAWERRGALMCAQGDLKGWAKLVCRE